MKKQSRLQRAMAKLSEREKKAVDGVLAGKSRTAALEEAGYSRKTAESQQVTIFSKSRVATALTLAMEERGITEERISSVLSEGLDAKRLVPLREGVVEYPDHSTRLKFVREINELRGEYPDKTILTQELSYEERLKKIRGLDDGDD